MVGVHEIKPSDSPLQVSSPGCNGGEERVALSPDVLMARGHAPVKREYLKSFKMQHASDSEPQRFLQPVIAANDYSPATNVSQSSMDSYSETMDDVAEGSGVARGTGGKISVVKKSKKAQKRERQQLLRSVEVLCGAVAKAGIVEGCRYGERCQFNHNIAAYLAHKPPDLPGPCPFFTRSYRRPYPYPSLACPFGITCRFSSSHPSNLEKAVGMQSVSQLQQLEEVDSAQAGAAAQNGGGSNRDVVVDEGHSSKESAVESDYATVKDENRACTVSNICKGLGPAREEAAFTFHLKKEEEDEGEGEEEEGEVALVKGYSGESLRKKKEYDAITGETNSLPKGLQRQLWKNRVKFRRTNACLRALGILKENSRFQEDCGEDSQTERVENTHPSSDSIHGETVTVVLEHCAPAATASAGSASQPCGTVLDYTVTASAVADTATATLMQPNSGKLLHDVAHDSSTGNYEGKLHCDGGEGDTRQKLAGHTAETQLQPTTSHQEVEGKGDDRQAVHLQEAAPAAELVHLQQAAPPAACDTFIIGHSCSSSSKSRTILNQNKNPNGNVQKLNDVQCARYGGDWGVVGEDKELVLGGREKRVVDFQGKLYLAPLTTVGNLPFRRLCKQLGADITCGEMAMATNLLQGQSSEWALLRRHESEDVFGVQICGSHPDSLARASELIERVCNVDFVDINMGCPIDIVCNKGAGSALLNKVSRMEMIVRAVSGTLDCPLTVKLRSGYTEKCNTVHNVLPRLREWGATAATVHARSRQQRYSKLADWDYLTQECATQEVTGGIQLVGNGDVFSFVDYNERMEGSRIATCMIARGALIKPWIFTEIKEQRHWDISASERLDVLKDYCGFGLQHWGSDNQGVEATRRFLLEWLSFLHRYIPVGLLEIVPQKMVWRPPLYFGRNDLETLMASDSAADWVRISEMLLGPAPPNFTFTPKHKSNAYDSAENG